MDPLVTVALILIGVIAVAILFGLDALKSLFNKKKSAARMTELAQGRKRFSLAWKAGVLPAVDTGIVLRDKEHGIFEEPSALYESRSYRIFGGGGTRIAGIYVGGGASEAHQRLRQIDSGNLVLTNQRLVFDGEMESRAVYLKGVISAKPWADGDRGEFEPTPKKPDLYGG